MPVRSPQQASPHATRLPANSPRRSTPCNKQAGLLSVASLLPLTAASTRPRQRDDRVPAVSCTLPLFAVQHTCRSECTPVTAVLSTSRGSHFRPHCNEKISNGVASTIPTSAASAHPYQRVLLHLSVNSLHLRFLHTSRTALVSAARAAHVHCSGRTWRDEHVSRAGARRSSAVSAHGHWCCRASGAG
jgi:hypothetical protein